MAIAIFAVALAGTLTAPRSFAAEPTALRVGTLGADAAAEPFYAQELGFFRAAGLDVQLSVLPTGAALTSAMVAGDLDVVIVTTAVAAIAHRQHLPVHLIAGASLYDGPPATSAIMVAKDSTVASGADLNGKTIAVIGLRDVSQFSTAAWIDKHGGDSRTVKFVEVPTSQMAAALAQHRVDAALIPEPFVTAAAPYARTIGDAQGAIGSHYLLLGWLAADGWIAKNAGTVRAFNEAILRAGAWANAHPDQSAAILLRNSKLAPEIALKMARAAYATGPLTPALIQPVIDAAAQYGIFDQPFNAKELIATPAPR